MKETRTVESRNATALQRLGGRSLTRHKVTRAHDQSSWKPFFGVNISPLITIAWSFSLMVCRFIWLRVAWRSIWGLFIDGLHFTSAWHKESYSSMSTFQLCWGLWLWLMKDDLWKIGEVIFHYGQQVQGTSDIPRPISHACPFDCL